MTWGGIFHPKDTSGRESRTLFFVGVTIFLLWGALGLLFWEFSVRDIDVVSFADSIVRICGAIVLVLGAWIGREWVKQ